MVAAPEYSARNVRQSSERLRDWAAVTVEYETHPKWIDQISFKYFVLLRSNNKDDKDAPYTLLEGEVSYIEVKEGQHTSAIFMHPSTIERYGEVVACAVEILYGDEKVEKTDIAGKAPVTGLWWKSLGSEKTVTVKTGYLLNRAKTPFAFINYDSYEQILRR